MIEIGYGRKQKSRCWNNDYEILNQVNYIIGQQK